MGRPGSSGRSLRPTTASGISSIRPCHMFVTLRPDDHGRIKCDAGVSYSSTSASMRRRVEVDDRDDLRRGFDRLAGLNVASRDHSVDRGEDPVLAIRASNRSRVAITAAHGGRRRRPGHDAASRGSAGAGPPEHQVLLALQLAAVMPLVGFGLENPGLGFGQRGPQVG